MQGWTCQYKPNWKIDFPDKREQKILCLDTPLVFHYIAILNQKNKTSIKSTLAVWLLKWKYKRMLTVLASHADGS